MLNFDMLLKAWMFVWELLFGQKAIVICNNDIVAYSEYIDMHSDIVNAGGFIQVFQCRYFISDFQSYLLKYYVRVDF